MEDRAVAFREHALVDSFALSRSEIDFSSKITTNIVWQSWRQ